MVDGATVEWLKEGRLIAPYTDSGIASAWPDAFETEIMSPLALASDALVEAARQQGFLKGPLAEESADVPGLRSDLLGKCVTISSSNLGYAPGLDVFVIGVEEQELIERTKLTVLRRLLWAPSLLFAPGQAGVWFDPSDLSSMFQDSAGTTPAAVNSPVGKINDKSGNGNHATQATAAARPMLRQDGDGYYYLEFDGTDDALLSSTFTIATPVERISALRQVAYTSGDFIYAGSTSTGGLRLGQIGTSPALNIRSSGVGPSTSDLPVAVNGILTERFDGSSSRIAVNTGSYATGDTGTTTADRLVIGRDAGGTVFSSIRLYGVVMRAGTLTDGQMTGLRCWLAAKAGVTLT
jgi:hypothetical protein